MNFKHRGELIYERHFKEVAKLSLIFVNSKDCLEKPEMNCKLVLNGVKIIHT
jgi:hypothetical protein